MKSGAHRGALVRFRILVTSMWSAARALAGWLLGRGERARVHLKPGDPAPDFVLPASDGRVYRLSDFRGKTTVVIAWFPKAFTAGCTAECSSLGSSAKEIRAAGVQLFGASMDRPDTNREFASALGLEYPILSDVDGRVARSYGVVGVTGYPSRWTFVVGRDGRIQDVDRRVRARSHGPDILTRLGTQT